MTGSLQQKRGIYQLVINTYENGKRKPLWISTGLPVKGNKRKAERLLREKLQEFEAKATGKPVQPDVTFADYVRRWLTIAQRKVDPVTYQGYEILAKTHILPYFDATGIKLRDVTLDVLQAYVDEKATKGRKDGKGGLSPKSVRMHINVIRQTMEEAVKNDMIPKNPCHYLILPRKQRYQSTFYNVQQLQALFDAIQDDPLCPFYKVVALYGLRRSEALGLKWDSVDFERKTLTIKHTVSKVTQAVEKDTTKTASSYRSFPLLPEAAAIFHAEQAAQAENRRLFGREYHPSDYIFTWPDGRLISPDHVTRHFSRLLKKHGLPHIRFHELRHSCASLLINEGFTLKDIQEWMGHADIQTTANIYGHLDVARKQSMADKLGEALGGLGAVPGGTVETVGPRGTTPGRPGC